MRQVHSLPQYQRVHSGIISAKNVAIGDRVHTEETFYHVTGVSTDDGNNVVISTSEGVTLRYMPYVEIMISWID